MSLLAVLIAGCAQQPAATSAAKRTESASAVTEADAVKIYKSRSDACELVRLGLLVCAPGGSGDAAGDAMRAKDCKQWTEVLRPLAFEQLQSSVAGDAAKLQKVAAFKQRTEDRLAHLASRSDVAAESRADCFALLDELE